MHEAILARLITLLTLNVNLSNEKFGTTLLAAARSVLEQQGQLNDVALQAFMITESMRVLAGIHADREAVAAHFSKMKDGCGECGHCRVVAWAKKYDPPAPPTTPDMEAEAKRLAEAALAEAKK